VLLTHAEARPRLVRGPVFKTGGGSHEGVAAGSIPVRFRQNRMQSATAGAGFDPRALGKSCTLTVRDRSSCIDLPFRIR